MIKVKLKVFKYLLMIKKTYHQDIDLIYFIIPSEMVGQIEEYALTHHLLLTNLKRCSVRLILMLMLIILKINYRTIFYCLCQPSFNAW